MELTKFTTEQSVMIEAYGTKISVNGEEWFNLPLWYRKHQDCFFESVKPDSLPDYVKKIIEINATEP